MNQHDAYDARLAQALDDLAGARVPDYTPDVLARTRRTRQRPAWTFLERWFPMTTIAQRAPVARPLAIIPRGLLILIALWAIIALTVAGLAIGGRLTSSRAVMVPAPVTGPAANGLIAFERGGDIHVAEPDGTGERPLIEAPGVQTAPSWSRDGTRIAFWSASTDVGPWDVMIANADGSNPVSVATDLLFDFPSWSGPDWSPDGSALVFATQTVPRGEAPCTDTTSLMGANCSWRIFTAATDGSTGAVSIGDPGLDARSPTLSPDGTIIAFAGRDAAMPFMRLYLMDVDGGDVRPISTTLGDGYSFVGPSWSPDGSQIAIAAGQSGYDIVLAQADGSGESKLTDTLTHEDRPTFAADGTIGWYGEGEDPCCVQVSEADGDRVALPGGSPIWSPDASLALTSASDESPHFTVVARDGTVVATIPNAAWPSWQRLAP